MDPIYLREGHLTPKSDIYCFGAVLLELIARKRVKEGKVNLIGTFCKACADGERIRELFDAEIANRTDTNILDEIANLATECLSLDIDRRPQINYVAEHLRMIQAQIKGQEKSAGPFFQGPQNHDTKIFTKKDIERITSNYSTPIRRGVFGEVYRGFLDDEDVVVTVKRFIRGDLSEDFMRQVSIRSQINHKNAGKLIGYCIGENTLMMVTEYFSNGNLDDALHNSGIPIPLGTRLDIAIGCAEALSYMHSMHLSNDSFVCHGDIKPANISLDANLIAKVTDFWNAKLHLGGLTFYTSFVIGTRKRIREVNLIEAFHRAYAKGKGIEILFDKDIINVGNVKILEDIAKLATKCLTLEIDRCP
uniref:Protein kinase domain-containing protein n=1 Tax=Oryza punctata TaxID=4537 RepID=A0A0E0JYG1_ORYPU